MRCTCVSTTTPSAMPNHDPSTTLAVLRAAPGTVSSSSMVCGTSPPKSLMILRAAPTTDFDLLRKNPVERMSGSSSSGCSAAKCAGVGYFLNRIGRDHVDAHVGALRRENGRHQQFPCAVVVQRAFHVGIALVEALAGWSATRVGGEGVVAPSSQWLMQRLIFGRRRFRRPE